MNISLNEWMTLLQGMLQGLHHSSLTGFYQLCRAVLVKSEADFDRFDQIFSEFFHGVPFTGELPDELMNWLNHPEKDLRHTMEELKAMGFTDEELETLLKMLEERLKEQTEQHNGGSYWVGTQGSSVFGNSGWRPNTIRVGGESMHRAAAMVAGSRRYRDFRRDNTLDKRQFQMAFRLLRQLSVQNDSIERELDVDNTIHETCENAGTLSIHYKKPRKNTVKVILLMDSGGSMSYYSDLCSQLFHAAQRANNFKELHTFYFHNCVYDELYSEPTLDWEGAVNTSWLLQNFDSSYKVILVGDAAMNPSELKQPHYDWDKRAYGRSGLEWLQELQKHFPYLVWLNPEPMPTYSSFWTQTHYLLGHMLPMYQLTAEGLEQSMKRLMVRR